MAEICQTMEATSTINSNSSASFVHLEQGV